MNADERAVLVALKKDVLPVRDGILGAAVVEKIPRVGKLLAAQFAVFAHGCWFLVLMSLTPSQIAAGKRKGAFPNRIPSEARKSPERNHKRRCAMDGASAISRPFQ